MVGDPDGKVTVEMKMKDIIFDFGQVLVRFEPEIMVSPYASCEEDVRAVSEVLFDRLYWDRLDAGTITDDEVTEAVCARLPERLHRVARESYVNWMYNLPEMPGMRELLTELKERGHRLFLLSNISRGFAEKEEEIPILRFFDGKVYSAVCGLAKPDPEIFKYICRKFSIVPQNAIFIDDKEKNCISARSVGMEAVVFSPSAESFSKFFYNSL